MLYNMFCWWILYVNRRVAVPALEALENLGANAPFTLEPILL